MMELSYPSAGAGLIRCRLWEPKGEAAAVVQLVHGIAEHAARYADFAAYLAEHGFVVAAQDHMGHGASISEACPRGCVRGGWDAMAADVNALTRRLNARYPDRPLFLLGHSMGSFLARTCLYAFPETPLRGVILSGTAWQPAAALAAGRLLSRAAAAKNGADAPAPGLTALMFGAYDRRFPEVRSPNDWICSDRTVVERYDEDPLCGFTPSAGLIAAMMDGLRRNQRAANLRRMPRLPVLFLAGAEDPVGSFGRGVRRSCAAFRRAGMEAELTLYPGARHEVLNETCRGQVYADALRWMEARR